MTGFAVGDQVAVVVKASVGPQHPMEGSVGAAWPMWETHETCCGCHSNDAPMSPTMETPQPAMKALHDKKNSKTKPNDAAYGGRGDFWLPAETDSSNPLVPSSYALLFDKPMLQRYILLCAQDVNGGLRDKPSKPRDFYHSCYNLSGLAMTQHFEDASAESFGHPVKSQVAASHPCYNIRLDRVPQMLDHFKD